MPLKKRKSRKGAKKSLNELKEITRRVNATYIGTPLPIFLDHQQETNTNNLQETSINNVQVTEKQSNATLLPEQLQERYKTSRETFIEELIEAQKKINDSEDRCGEKKALTKDEIEDLKSVFDIFDMQNVGKISRMDLQRALRFLRFKFREHDFKKIIENFDEGIVSEENTSNNNHNSGIHREYFSFDIFLHCVSELQSTSRNIRAEIQDGFKSFDLENKGRITIHNLKYLNKHNKLGFSDQELHEMLREADADGDGEILEEEFLRTMMKTNLFV